jgi:carbon-monoxide dehydrogenase large subunit
MNKLMVQAEIERVRKVTGNGRYTADERFVDAARGVFVRSPHAHARIVSIDIAEALAMPGVLGIVTGQDCVDAGLRNFPVLSRWGAVAAPHRPVLAHETVRYVGEAVACVVAETQAQAMDAAEAVLVEYDSLPAAIGVAGALAEGAPLVHDALRGNVVFRHQNGDAEAVAAAMAAAAMVIETEIEVPRLAPVTLEPRASVASWDEAAGLYTLRTPHQGVNEIRRDLAAVFGLAGDRFKVLPGDVGGGFGPRNVIYPELPALLMAARRTGRAVAWHGTRTESFLTDLQGRGVRLRGRLALDADGNFTALSMQYDSDLGAYVSPVAVIANINNPLQSLIGCYRIPQAHAAFQLVMTNAAPTGPYRGAGRPEMSLLIERLVDIAGRRRAEDPFALRARNAIPKAAFPYTLPSGAVYDSANFAALLDAARIASDWDGFGKRREAASARGKTLGHGMALFIEVSGGGMAADEAALTLSSTGAGLALRIETVTGASGQSHPRTFANIACPRLGLSEEAVEFIASAHDTTLSGAGSYASRSTIATGSAVALAADEIAAKLRGLAALRGNCAAEELHLADGVARHDNGTEICSIASLLAEPIAATGRFAPVNAFASGCHVAELEIDRETGVAALVRYVAVDDSGVTIDHQAAEAQIHGGIAQGVGEVLTENAVIDGESGQPVAASLMDYTLPRADDVPDYVVVECNTPSPSNPIGVKGIGEAGTTGALCAVTSAIADAVGDARLPLLPATAQRLWQALQPI